MAERNNKMRDLYQILAEDYRDYQIKEPIRQETAKRLVESHKAKAASSLKESVKTNRATAIKDLGRKNLGLKEASLVNRPKRNIKEACEKEEEEIIKGSEKEDKKIVKEEAVVDEEISEEVKPDEEEKDTPEEVLSKIAMVAGLSKEEIETAMAELPDEEKEAVKANFELIKNTAMELFPEEVAEDVEEITEEIPEEPIEEEPLEECEISSFKVTRIAPKVGAVMIEAQTKEGLKYITGKNFNESEKTLDEAEISADKNAASNRFKGFLK